MNPTELANVATLNEAAEICGVNRDALYSAIKRGDVPARRGCVPWLVDLEDVKEWKHRPRCPRRQEIRQLWDDGMPPEAIAERMGIMPRSVHKALNRMGILLRAAPRASRAADDEFQRVWEAASDPREVSAHFGMRPDWARCRACKLRRRGLQLKRFKPGRKERAA